jgi:integration host factor subunit beta
VPASVTTGADSALFEEVAQHIISQPAAGKRKVTNSDQNWSQLFEEKGKSGKTTCFLLLSTPESVYAESGGPIDMTKADLVEKVTGLGDLTRRDGEVIVETIFGSVIGALQGGDKIEIRGFGSFRIRQRNPRIGRNPKTGERVEVPAKRVPYFKPSKELRDLVNPGEAEKAK